MNIYQEFDPALVHSNNGHRLCGNKNNVEQSGEFPNLFNMPLSEMVKGITAAITVACSK